MKKKFFILCSVFLTVAAFGQSDPSVAFFDKGLEQYFSQDYSNAEENFSKAIALDKKSELAYYNRGLVRLALLRYSDALKDFSKSIKIKKEYANGYLGKGAAYLGKGKNEKAISSLKTALKYDEGSYLSHYNIGLAYFNLKKFDEATLAFNKALDIYPDYVDALVYKGLVNYEKGDYKTAITTFDEAAKADSANSMVYFNRALSKIKLDYQASACLDLRKALELGYERAEVMLRIHCVK